MKILNKYIEKLKGNPPLLLGGTFAVVILVGALLLCLPFSSTDGKSATFTDALFTSASATCVTGLIVRNTAEGWTTFGKLVIITLIQIGGLGTMTIISMISVILRRRIGLQERLAIKEQLNSVTLSGMVRLIRYVVTFSLIVELIGALILSIRFVPMFGWGRGICFGLFHSISAFCNAGFDILGNSIVPYSADPIINLTIMLLIIMGGLGFGVYVDMYRKRKMKNFSLHTKMVLAVTAVLLAGGTLLFLILEYGNPETMKAFSLPHKVLAAGFQSTIARTAGFNSIDVKGMTDASAFVMIILMFIGGSPGSTAGGLKTTTFGVLLLSVISTIRGEDYVVWRKRTIPGEVIKKSFVMAFIASILVVGVTCFIAVVEHDAFDFLDILFETVSAFGTVGVSRGITSSLSDPSKWILTLTMFLGRVGPTSIALGLGKGLHKKKIRYAEGNIIVG